MRKLLLILTCFVIATAAVSCGQKEALPSFEATAIQTEPSLLVAPAEDAPEASSGSEISVGMSQAQVFGADGKEAPLSTIPAGTRLKIVYDGNIMETYPPQISALEIHILGT